MIFINQQIKHKGSNIDCFSPPHVWFK